MSEVMLIKQNPFYKWLSIGLIIVIIWLLYRSCNPAPIPVAPIVTPTSVLKEIVRVDSIASKKYSDSVNNIIRTLQKTAEEKEKENDALALVNVGLQKDMDDYITNTVVPDTCKEYIAQISTLNKKLSQSTAAQEAACKAALNAQKGVVNQKDKLIDQGKQDYSKLRNVLDTALSNQDALTKALKKNRPRREIGIGLIGQSAWISPYKFEGGPMLYYRGKNGTQFSAGVLTSQRIQITLSKTLFKL